MSDHDKYRSKVCVVCLQKTARDRPLSARDIELILRFARENYDVFDSDYPSGLCGGCTLTEAVQKGERTKHRPQCGTIHT